MALIVLLLNLVPFGCNAIKDCHRHWAVHFVGGIVGGSSRSQHIGRKSRSWPVTSMREGGWSIHLMIATGTCDFVMDKNSTDASPNGEIRPAIVATSS